MGPAATYNHTERMGKILTNISETSQPTEDYASKVNVLGFRDTTLSL